MDSGLQEVSGCCFYGFFESSCCTPFFQHSTLALAGPGNPAAREALSRRSTRPGSECWVFGVDQAQSRCSSSVHSFACRNAVARSCNYCPESSCRSMVRPHKSATTFPKAVGEARSVPISLQLLSRKQLEKHGQSP